MINNKTYNLFFNFFFSIRKSEKILKTSLESIIVPMFCSAMMRANEDQKTKLSKVRLIPIITYFDNFM